MNSIILIASVLDRLWQAWAFLTTGRVMAIVAGIGFALLAIFLLVASRTRWGQSKPLTKCVVLSILAHIWLLMYAMGVRTVLPQGDPHGQERGLAMNFEQMDLPTYNATPAPTPDWEQPVPLAELPAPPELESADKIQWDQPPELLQAIAPTPLPELPADLLDQLKPDESPIAAVEPPVLEATPPYVAPPAPQANNQLASSTTSPLVPPQMPVDSQVPKEYQLRQLSNRLDVARAYGADADTEAAVEAALEWLARSQSEDGSWNAARFGAGTETRALGEYRHNTGNRADTGISGLALLAFLSAGHTHLDGRYRQVVERGLSYLIQVQMPSGDLSGPKQIGPEQSVVNARMYCHSIAMLALAEAHAMTHDLVLREALLKAAGYSIAAQHVGGGWRYIPGNPGDLSLFGWKAMALKSVSRSGIEVPTVVERRMRSFLDSCAAGKGGLARYRPSEGAPSETMTAEALACRLLLDYPISIEARQEATQMIMSNLPGTKPDNVYYWYYATLALFQLQDENWRVWNGALKARLLQTQEPAHSSEAGSWTPDGIWGGYGGRVYSTAMSSLCLEVYYRYLPLYQRSNLARSPGQLGTR